MWDVCSADIASWQVPLTIAVVMCVASFVTDLLPHLLLPAPDTFATQEEFLMGPAILVKPVGAPGVATVETFLPRVSKW